jgi:hypothetical protein
MSHNDEKRLERIEIKIDKLADGQAEMNATLAKQAALVERNTDDVTYHIKRTDLLEAKYDSLIYKLLGAGAALVAIAKYILP